MNRFYKVPNAIFDYKLNPSAFYLYTHLSNRFYWKKSIRIKLKTISDRCSMSVNTVRSALAELEANHLICKIPHKHFQSGYITTYEYKIYRLPGSFAMIDSKAFIFLKNDKSAAYIYCAVAHHQNRCCRSYPSYRQIILLTGLSRATVISKVNRLNALGMLCRERYICSCGAFGHNNYAVISMKFRIFLFSFICRLYGRFIVLFEACEYGITASSDRSGRKIITIRHTKRTTLWVSIYHSNPLLRSKKSKTSFYFHGIGGLNFDKPITDPNKLRKKLKKKVKSVFTYKV